MAIDKLELDSISKIILDQMNPTAAKDLVVRRSQLVDNPGAVYQEILANAYSPNKFAGKSDFQGIVLLNVEVNGSLISYLSSFIRSGVLGLDAKEKPRLMFCMVPELHAALGNPFISLANSGPFEYIKRVLRFPAFQTAVQGVIGDKDLALLKSAQIGSTVNINMVNGDVGRVTKLIASAEMDRFVFDNPATVGGSTQAFTSGNAVVSADAVEFYNKLRSSGAFSGYSDTMLMGLAANAKQESNFTSNAAGDARSPGNKDHPRTITTVDGVRGVEADYCSFGYFQLNICPDNAEGTRFIEFFGLDRSNKQEVLDAITNEEKQFQFMANRLAQIGSISQYIGQEVAEGYSEEETAAFYGRLIARDFENCSACADGQSENRERQELAAALYRELRPENVS